MLIDQSIFWPHNFYHAGRQTNKWPTMTIVANSEMCTKVKYKFDGTRKEHYYTMNVPSGHITVQDLKMHVLNGRYKMPRRVCNKLFDKIQVVGQDDGCSTSALLHSEQIDGMKVMVCVNHPLVPEGGWSPNIGPTWPRDPAPKTQRGSDPALPTSCPRAYYKFDTNTREHYDTMHGMAGHKRITVQELKVHILTGHCGVARQDCDKLLDKMQVLHQEDWRGLSSMPNCEWVEDMEVLIHVDHPLVLGQPQQTLKK